MNDNAYKQIEKIKSNEGKPKVLKNIFSEQEIEKFLNLYNELPVTVHNKKQNVIKKMVIRIRTRIRKNIL